MVVLLLCSALVRHTWTVASSFGLPVQEGYGHTGTSAAKGHADGLRLEHLSYKERLMAYSVY